MEIQKTKNSKLQTKNHKIKNLIINHLKTNKTITQQQINQIFINNSKNCFTNYYIPTPTNQTLSYNNTKTIINNLLFHKLITINHINNFKFFISTKKLNHSNIQNLHKLN